MQPRGQHAGSWQQLSCDWHEQPRQHSGYGCQSCERGAPAAAGRQITPPLLLAPARSAQAPHYGAAPAAAVAAPRAEPGAAGRTRLEAPAAAAAAAARQRRSIRVVAAAPVPSGRLQRLVRRLHDAAAEVTGTGGGQPGSATSVLQRMLLGLAAVATLQSRLLGSLATAAAFLAVVSMLLVVLGAAAFHAAAEGVMALLSSFRAALLLSVAQAGGLPVGVGNQLDSVCSHWG